MKGYESACPDCEFVAFERSQKAADYVVEWHLSAVHHKYGSDLDGEDS